MKGRGGGCGERVRSWTSGLVGSDAILRGLGAEEGGEEGGGGRGTYPCFHTGGTSDARYGASRPALAAPYTRCTV